MSKFPTFKNTQREIQLYSQRILIAVAAILVVSLVLIARITYLQVFQRDMYKTLSNQNQLALLPLEPNRGLIYDRNGVLLAENIPVFSLELIPDKVKKIDHTIEELKQLITLNSEEIEEFHKHLKQHRRFESIIIKQKLSKKEVAKFSINQYKYPGVSVQAHLLRNYPLGDIMAHVLGYVGRINSAEINKVDPANYSATNYIGKVGVEKYYENTLHGQVGMKKVETDVSGRTVRVLHRDPPTPGKNIYLSIDTGLQLVAKKAMGNNHGAIVALDPNNGEILALVSSPSYDPNKFVMGISTKELAMLQSSPSEPLYNRALRGQYPPASTIKPFLALEALETGATTIKRKLFDPGWFKLENNNHLYHDWRPKGHGELSLRKALIVSCDTYFYDLASRMGIKPIDTIMRKFGFGEPTGIDMGEELPGLVPTPKWKFKHKGHSWYVGDTINLGIGQGYMLVTPLQLAIATAAIGMHGQRYQPHLLIRSEDDKGNKTTKEPIPLAPVQVKNQYFWTFIIRAMEGVIKYGTGYQFGHDTPYRAAGKTGTAQVFSMKEDEEYISENIPKRLRDHSLFIAFAPAEKPEIAVAVIVENGHYAAAMTRDIIDYYILRGKDDGPPVST